MKLRYVLLFLGLFGFAIGHAQYDEDECSKPVKNKKIKKLLEQSHDRKNFPLKERWDFAKETIEIDGECVECYYRLAKLSWAISHQNGMGYDQALKFYKKVWELCETYHADVPYQIGLIHFAQGKYAASVPWFEKFLAFESEDPKKFTRKYDKQYEDVEEVIPVALYLEELYNNPVPYAPIKINYASSRTDDYLPMLARDDSELYFVRKLNITKKGDIGVRVIERLFKSDAIWDDTLTQGSMLFEEGSYITEIDSLGDATFGASSLSLDKKEMYIAIGKVITTNQGIVYNNFDIYVSYRSGGMWSIPENLGPNVNAMDGWDSHPSISADGKTLYFATAREDSKSTDIFASERQPDGSWGKAAPLGDSVNYGNKEKSPFIANDGRTLYLASDRFLGVGQHDLYVSRKKKDGSWTLPKNLGVPINTDGSEHEIIVSADGSKGLFASNRIQGSFGMDLYSFELYDEIRPDMTKLVSGQLEVDMNNPQHTQVWVTRLESDTTDRVKVDMTDGYFITAINLEDEPKVFTLWQKGRAFHSRLYSAKDTLNFRLKDKVGLDRISTGTKYYLHGLALGDQSTNIYGANRYLLNQLGDYLQVNSQYKVDISGLSQVALEAVKSYLSSNGIAASRIRMVEGSPSSGDYSTLGFSLRK